MSKPKILLQLDSDPHASVFDAVVAVDSGVDHLLQYHSVETTLVQGLVHGAIFTRSPKHLANTAIFIGGANMSAGESLLSQVRASFVGPMKVSVMLDCNGANTTASAAVLSMVNHVNLAESTVTVLAGTGPVGQRVARLLARAGAAVRVGSRSHGRAAAVCDTIKQRYPDADISPSVTLSPEDTGNALGGADAVVAAGASGIELLRREELEQSNIRLAVDLNAVPPAGIEVIDPHDFAAEKNGVLCFGAIGVGGAKMKIHKAAIEKLFTANDLMLDAEEIYDIGVETSAV